MPKPARHLLTSMLGQRCPHCRTGKLFLNPNPFNFKMMEKMPPECPVCGQDFVIEPGFYFGATYVSYALNVAWLIPLFLVIRFGLGFSFRTFVVVMFVLLPILIPIIFRISRSIWLHFIVKYDPLAAGKGDHAD